MLFAYTTALAARINYALAVAINPGADHSAAQQAYIAAHRTLPTPNRLRAALPFVFTALVSAGIGAAGTYTYCSGGIDAHAAPVAPISHVAPISPVVPVSTVAPIADVAPVLPVSPVDRVPSVAPAAPVPVVAPVAAEPTVPARAVRPPVSTPKKPAPAAVDIPVSLRTSTELEDRQPIDVEQSPQVAAAQPAQTAATEPVERAITAEEARERWPEFNPGTIRTPKEQYEAGMRMLRDPVVARATVLSQEPAIQDNIAGWRTRVQLNETAHGDVTEADTVFLATKQLPPGTPIFIRKRMGMLYPTLWE